MKANRARSSMTHFAITLLMLLGLAANSRETARLRGMDKEIVSLEPGNCADFVVLSENLVKIGPMKIKDIKALQTIKGGEPIYAKKQRFTQV